ncbi:MAG TPA: hypothetical protein VF101_16010 [Gaiellaceae bacterium]
MNQTQVILVKMPRILREIVRRVVASRNDLTVFDGPDDEAVKMIQAGEACVAITSLDDPATQSLAPLLGHRPELRVIALSPDGRSGTVYDLRLQQQAPATGELSPAELLAAIRQPLAYRDRQGGTRTDEP